MPSLLIMDRDSTRAEALVRRIGDVPGLAILRAKQDLATFRLVRESVPDVILLGLDDLESWILTGLVAAFPDVPIIAYADHYDSASMRKVVVFGARDLLSAQSSREAILSVVLQALRKSAA